MMDASGAPQDASSHPLTRQEILQLIGPIIPEHARRRLPQETSVEFDHASPSGAFKVTILRNGSEIAVSIVPDHGRAPAPPRAACDERHRTASRHAAAPSHAAPPPHHPPCGRCPRDATGAPAIDRLFHLMVERKASDLHLSIGDAAAHPQGRQDCSRSKPDAQPMTPTEMVALLDPITPQPNLDEFARRNDTDFAYEIKGLARFRANVFLDRKGRGAVFRVIPAKILTAEELGLSPHILKLCKLNKGLVLVTGPTGSGKSTTLCAMIDYINRTRNDHIITIEDPIEFVHENKSCLINQREVGTHTDGFKDGAARRDARGSGHHAGRRAARSRNGGHRDRDGGNRPPGVRHAAHDHGGIHRRSRDRSVPDRAAGADPHHAVGVAEGRDRAEPVPQDRRRPRRRARSAADQQRDLEPDPRSARRSRSRR